MKVKKYKAVTMPEAMKQIRRELGRDAIILNSREVNRDGLFGFFAKKYLEVTAAADSNSQTPPYREGAALAREPSEERFASMIRKLEADIRNIKGTSYPGPLAEVHERLHEQEIEISLTEGWMRPLIKQWYTSDESLGEKKIYELLRDQIIGRLEKETVAPSAYDKKYLIMAGPTGVGKTTTIAKIAAKAKFEDHKKIAMITADTYRVAAVDQLKAYADILKVPIRVAYTSEGFQNAKRTSEDFDLVLVDTAGRNYRERSYIDELKSLIPFDENMQTWLVLSMTARYQDMRAVFRKFSGLAPRRCVLTKIDETRTYGAVVNFWLKDGIAPAFLTNGQNVPDDLLIPKPDRVAQLLLGINEQMKAN